MRMMLLFLAVVLSNIISANSKPSTINFFEGDFNSAIEKAGQEGKLFFVDFYASWCTPCIWMDETTFSDIEVIEVLSENYIAMKIDIDDLDGYNIKQKYQIHILPSLLIFNSKGEIVERIEETLAPRKMVELLLSHKNDIKLIKQHSLNSSPQKNIAISNNLSELSQAQEEAAITNTPSKTKFRIQVGVFKEYENTYNLVDSLKSKLEEPLLVLSDYQNSKHVYRVLIGEFNTELEAQTFQNRLENEFNIKGIIK